MCKRKYILGLVLGLVLLLFAAAAFAQSGGISVTNHLHMGSVALDLTAYSVTDGAEVEAEDGYAVTPNQTISYIPRVTNLRADCYVRLRVEVDMDGQTEEPITADSIEGLNANWIKKGDFFYYKKVLKTDEEVDVFQAIHVPNWTTKSASGFKIDLVADAVQADGFRPDFNSNSPWGTIEIEETKKGDTSYRVGKPVSDPKCLIYKGNSTFEVTSQDFFENFNATMLPNGQFADAVELKNEANHTIKLQFKSTTKDTDLLDQIGLKILIGDKTFYNGSLAAADLSDDVTLTKIPAKETQKMRYVLTIPKNLQNEYSTLKDSVVWSFKAMEIDEKGKAVQTGDDWNLLPYVFLGLAAMVLLSVFFTAKKRRK